MSGRTVAIIEIGSTGVRAVVAAIESDGAYRILDRADKEVSLGRDVFTTGAVGRQTMSHSIAVLRGMRELLKTYGIEAKDAHVIATSALREASNRDTFVDRVSLRTGFVVDIIEDIEENHLMYLAVQRALGDDFKSYARSNMIILEVGGGSTEIMMLRRGKMAAAHSLRIGTVRIDEQVRSSKGSLQILMRYLGDNIRTTCDMLDADMRMASVRYFIVIGSDARLAAGVVGRKVGDEYAIVEREAFEKFVSSLASMRVEEIVNKFEVGYSEAESLLPSLLIIKLFLDRTNADELIVPIVSMREGLLVGLAGGVDSDIERELDGQVIASAVSLGRKFHFDEDHARHVAALSLVLFDELSEEHGLKRRERLLLETAAVLHDIGTFIRTSGHHRHSEYIVLNSDIFGLQRDDLIIVANCVRYHRKSGPASSHPNFMGLSREDRIVVLKLASMLRVADALDRGHTQHVRIVGTERKEDHIVLLIEAPGDIALERISLDEKSDMFEDVFGLKVVTV